MFVFCVCVCVYVYVYVYDLCVCVCHSDYVPKVRNIWENYPPNDPRTKLMDKVR